MKYILAIAIITVVLLIVLVLWALCASVKVNSQIKELEKEIERGD